MNFSFFLFRSREGKAESFREEVERGYKEISFFIIAFSPPQQSIPKHPQLKALSSVTSRSLLYNTRVITFGLINLQDFFLPLPSALRIVKRLGAREAKKVKW